MKRKNSNLDERQEQVLLQIEHSGCWLAFWGLLAAIVVQSVVYGFEFEHIAGEWIVFMILSLYLAFACLKNGIWDRKLKPNLKTNLLLSAAAAIATGLIVFFSVFGKYTDKPAGAALSAVISAVMVFALCSAALILSARSYLKKQKKLEEEPEEDV